MASAKKQKASEAKPVIKLPEGVIAADLKYPSFKSGGYKLLARLETGGVAQIEMWNVVDRGWCIKTLPISTSRRVNQGYSSGERTYGVAISDGKVVTMGNGPHVTGQIIVYVKTSRLSALQKYLDLLKKGSEEANTIRDRISTRRSQGVLRRGGGGWF